MAVPGRMHALAEKQVNELMEIWVETGYEEIEIQSLLGDYVSQMTQWSCTFATREREILVHSQEQVVAKYGEYCEMCAQLGRIGKEEVTLGNNSTEKLAGLAKLIDVISIEVSQRQGLLNHEYATVEDLGQCLETKVPSLDSFKGPVGTPLLSDVRLNLIKECSRDLQIAKQAREEEMKALTLKCLDHMVR